MNRYTNVRRLVIALGVAILAIGCGQDKVAGSGTPGTLSVNLVTPNSGQDGAAVVVLSGPVAPTAVTAGSGLVLWGGPVQTAQATVALTGTLNAGTVLTIQVADIALASQYSATLREVAKSDSTVALRDLAGYSLAVVR